MEPTERTLTRRAVLGAGVAVLAGCASANKPTETAADPASATAGTVLVKVADIPVGDAVGATLDGQPILISQPTAGTIVAFTAICTHQGCTVAPAGKTFRCPCHDSIFDATTGQVISGPAPAALDSIPVKVSGGNVLTR